MAAQTESTKYSSMNFLDDALGKRFRTWYTPNFGMGLEFDPDFLKTAKVVRSRGTRYDDGHTRKK